MSETLTAERLAEIGKYARGVWSAEPYVDEAVIKPWELFCLLDAAEENGRLKVSADNLVLQAESIPATLEEVTRNLRTIAGYFMQRYGTYEKTCEAASLLDGTELLLLELLLDKFNLLVQLRNTMIEGDAALAQLAEWREVAEEASLNLWNHDTRTNHELNSMARKIDALWQKYPKGGE